MREKYRREKVLFVIALVAIAFVAFAIFSASSAVAFATDKIEVEGVLTVQNTSGNVIYNSKSQPLQDGFQVTFVLGGTSYSLVEGKDFIYKAEASWQFKSPTAEAFGVLDTEANNFVLAGKYRREVSILPSSEKFVQKPEGQQTEIEYTINRCSPVEIVGTTYRAVIGLKWGEVEFPRGWGIKPGTQDLGARFTESLTIPNIKLVFTVPAGEDENYYLEPAPGEKTVSIEVLNKPEIVFKGVGTSQTTLQGSLITYNSQTFRYSGDIIKNTFIKQGYKFRSFGIEGDTSEDEYSAETDALETMKASFDLPAKAKVIFVVNWDPRSDTKYKVEHFRQGLTDSTSYTRKATDTQTHEGETDSIVNIDPADLNDARIYKMPGFTYNPTKTEEANNYSGKIKADGSLILQLYYNRDSYKVEYKKGDDALISGEVPTDSKTYKFEEIIRPASGEGLTKPGYLFVGWKDGQTKVDDKDKVYVVNRSYPMIEPQDEEGVKKDTLTFTAIFEARKDTPYKVRHYNADGTLIKEINMTGETDVEVSAIATLAGYKVVDNAGSVPTGKIVADGSLVLKLYYELIDYTISFKQGGVDIMPSKTLNIDDIVVLPSAPTKEGYIFEAWSINGVKYSAGSEVTVKGNMNIEAIYLNPSSGNGFDNANNNSVFAPKQIYELSGGEIAGIVVSSAIVGGIMVFSIVWFGILKRSFKDMKIKKKTKKDGGIFR